MNAQVLGSCKTETGYEYLLLNEGKLSHIMVNFVAKTFTIIRDFAVDPDSVTALRRFKEIKYQNVEALYMDYKAFEAAYKEN